MTVECPEVLNNGRWTWSSAKWNLLTFCGWLCFDLLTTWAWGSVQGLVTVANNQLARNCTRIMIMSSTSGGSIMRACRKHMLKRPQAFWNLIANPQGGDHQQVRPRQWWRAEPYAACVAGSQWNSQAISETCLQLWYWGYCSSSTWSYFWETFWQL